MFKNRLEIDYLMYKKTTKGLGGQGKLTKTIINLLQNYYGIAIRSNAGNLKEMQKVTRATIFHVASSETNNYQSAYCPQLVSVSTRQSERYQ